MKRKKDKMLEKFLSRERIKVADRLIPFQYRKGRILDIGCGEYPYFLINTKFNEKYGIDEITRGGVFNNKNTEKIFIKKCNIEKDGLSIFDNEYFDVVTMLAVLEHLEPQVLPRIISEIKRVLKFNGILILTTPAPYGNIILQILSRLRLLNPVMIKQHKALYNIVDIASILDNGGFSKGDMRFGNFELFLNIWSSVVKK